MTAVELISGLRARGVEVTRDGEQLVLRGNTAAVTPRVRETLGQAKPALLQLLAEERPGWNEVEADALIAATYHELGEVIPAGAIGWAEAHRPELLKALDTAVAAWEGAYERRAAGVLAAALAELLAVCRTIAGAYAAVPAQMEMFGQ